MHIHDPSVPAPSDPSIIESNGNGNLNLNLTNSTSTSVFHRSLTDIPTRAVRAEGNYIYRESGQKVLDACGGAAVISIGHADQRVIAGLVQQMNTVGYVHSGAWANDVSFVSRIRARERRRWRVRCLTSCPCSFAGF